VLRNFFDAGRPLVEECMEKEGKTENLEVVMIGPRDSETLLRAC
jgi:hypothetical protein